MKYPPDIIQRWLDELEANPEKLTPWEVDFVESVIIQFKFKKDLTEKQENVLERIYAEKTP